MGWISMTARADQYVRAREEHRMYTGIAQQITAGLAEGKTLRSARHGAEEHHRRGEAATELWREMMHRPSPSRDQAAPPTALAQLWPTHCHGRPRLFFGYGRFGELGGLLSEEMLSKKGHPNPEFERPKEKKWKDRSVNAGLTPRLRLRRLTRLSALPHQ
jgi:hypothetical protein